MNYYVFIKENLFRRKGNLSYELDDYSVIRVSNNLKEIIDYANAYITFEGSKLQFIQEEETQVIEIKGYCGFEIEGRKKFKILVKW